MRPLKKSEKAAKCFAVFCHTHMQERKREFEKTWIALSIWLQHD